MTDPITHTDDMHMSVRATGLAAILLLALCALLAVSGPAAAAPHDTVAARLLREGRTSLSANDYNTALARYLEFIQMEEHAQKKDTADLLDTYYNIGGVYSVYQNFAQALDMYERGYRMSVEAGKPEWQFKFLNNMVGAGCNVGRPDYAARLNARLETLRGIDRGEQQFYYCFNKGFIAGCTGHQQAKARWMTLATEAVDRYRLPEKMKVYPYSEIYQCYESMGRLDEALSVLLKYEALAQSVNTAGRRQKDYNGQGYLLVDCYKGLMRVCTKMGLKDKALHYQNEFLRYNDSLLNVSEFSKIRNRHLNYENRQTQQVIESQRKTILYQKIILIMLAVLIVTAVTAAVVIRRQRKTLHDANVALFDKNNELESAATVRTAPPPSAQISDDLLRRIDSVMADERNFCDPDFSLATLARLVGSNTNYVSQAVNSAYGKNFRSFLNEHRIKEAMRRMKDVSAYGAYSIQGISESVGFKSASNFIAAFKKKTGMTPSIYQKLSRSE